MRPTIERARNQEGGFVFALIGISLVAILLVVGFAVDLGSWYLSASKLQRASDSAALTGAGSLPNIELAVADAEAAYLRNGFVDGQKGIEITVEATASSVITSVRDNEVKTYFTKSILPKIEINRESKSVRSTSGPVLGSPFNVLGTGDLEILGLDEKQNYWLAMNALCSPKEDGDYFGALREGNKGPFTTAQDENNNYLAPNGYHNCNGGTANPDYNPAGYSYFIDVPPPPEDGGYVDVYIYDPAFNGTNTVNPYAEEYPDVFISLGKDNIYMDNSFAFDLLDTMGTPGDGNDDESLLSHPHSVSVYDTRYDRGEWWLLGRIKSTDIGPDGGQFRVQIFNESDSPGGDDRGINAFSIGAFPSWNTDMNACDTRDDKSCPRVYARNAMSVNTNLESVGSTGETVDFYFAQIEKGYVGQTFNVMMWDPGEGVQKMELLMPDGTPIPFDWSTEPDGGSSYKGTNDLFIQTDGTGPPAYGQSLSNNYKFNGRLLTLRVTIPSDYAAAVDSADSDWLRMRYTIGTAATDRTTWGIGLAGGKSGTPYLVRPNP